MQVTRMRKFRTWTYIAIVAQVLSTGLAWVVNGDIISSIITSVLIPLSFAALGFAAMQIIAASSSRSIIRICSILLVLLSAAALILAIFTNDPSAALQPSSAVEAITVAAMVSALLLFTICYALWRSGVISVPVALVGLLASAGIIVSNIDSINLMVIAASRAVMILFLVLLSQSEDASYATSS